MACTAASLAFACCAYSCMSSIAMFTTSELSRNFCSVTRRFSRICFFFKCESAPAIPGRGRNAQTMEHTPVKQGYECIDGRGYVRLMSPCGCDAMETSSRTAWA